MSSFPNLCHRVDFSWISVLRLRTSSWQIVSYGKIVLWPVQNKNTTKMLEKGPWLNLEYCRESIKRSFIIRRSQQSVSLVSNFGRVNDSWDQHWELVMKIQYGVQYTEWYQSLASQQIRLVFEGQLVHFTSFSGTWPIYLKIGLNFRSHVTA